MERGTERIHIVDHNWGERSRLIQTTASFAGLGMAVLEYPVNGPTVQRDLKVAVGDHLIRNLWTSAAADRDEAISNQVFVDGQLVYEYDHLTGQNSWPHGGYLSNDAFSIMAKVSNALPILMHIGIPIGNLRSRLNELVQP